MAIRLRTLGGFSLEIAGGFRQDRLGQPVRSALLLLLALERKITRDRAVSLLWPESDQDHARQSLRQTCYLLRRDLGEDWVSSSHDHLRATPGFTADAQELVEASENGEHQRVTELYTGPFLDGVCLVGSQPFQLWCDQWRGRLERLHRQSRRAVIQKRVADGRLDEALLCAREWLDLDPLEDEAQHLVLELLTRLGRGDEALREYAAFSLLLASEGLEPIEQTLALVEEIRSHGRTLPTDVIPPDVPAVPGAEAAESEPANRLDRRPRRIATFVGFLVVAAAVMSVAMGVLRDRREERPLDPRRVMVLPLVNETGDSTLDVIGLLAADWITHTVAHIGGIHTVPFLDVRRMLETGAEAGEIAVNRHAGTLVSGRYFKAGDSLELHVRITDFTKQELWYALEPVRITAASPEDGLREIRDRVGGSLGVRFAPASGLPDPSALEPPNYPAFKALMDAAPHISSEDWAGALPHLQRAAALDSTFYRARFGLVSAYRSFGQFARADSVLHALTAHRESFSPYERLLYGGLDARLRGASNEALAVARQAPLIDPGGTIHYVSAGVALDAGRPRDALQLYASLDRHCPWAPEWLAPWLWWTSAFHLLGEHERELKEARRARAEHPTRAAAAFMELRALVGLGRLDALQAGLRQVPATTEDGEWSPGHLLYRLAIEMRVHGHHEIGDEVLEKALAWYASGPVEPGGTLQIDMGHLDALMAGNRATRAALLLAELRTRHGDRLDLLGREGVLAARAGSGEGAAVIMAHLDSRRAPYQFGAIDYWGAAIAAWSAQEQRSLALLRRAVEEGLPRGVSLHADPFLEPLWHLPAFHSVVAEQR